MGVGKGAAAIGQPPLSVVRLAAGILGTKRRTTAISLHRGGSPYLEKALPVMPSSCRKPLNRFASICVHRPAARRGCRIVYTLRPGSLHRPVPYTSEAFPSCGSSSRRLVHRSIPLCSVAILRSMGDSPGFCRS